MEKQHDNVRGKVLKVPSILINRVRVDYGHSKIRGGPDPNTGRTSSDFSFHGVSHELFANNTFFKIKGSERGTPMKIKDDHSKISLDHYRNHKSQGTDSHLESFTNNLLTYLPTYLLSPFSVCRLFSLFSFPFN